MLPDFLALNIQMHIKFASENRSRRRGFELGEVTKGVACGNYEILG